MLSSQNWIRAIMAPHVTTSFQSPCRIGLSRALYLNGTTKFKGNLRVLAQHMELGDVGQGGAQQGQRGGQHDELEQHDGQGGE